MRLFHGWIVVGAVHVVLFVIFGVAYSFAAFFNSFQQEFGASRGDVSVVFSICSFLYFLVGLFAGQIADRIGPRPVAIAGMAMLAVGLALAARAPSLTGLYVVYGVGVGLGVGCAYVPSIGAVLPWFVRRRGMASGIAAAGIGMGTLLIPPVTSALIATIGWRRSFDVLAIAVIVIGGGAAMLVDNAPARRGLAPDGAPATTPAGVRAVAGLTLREAIATPVFRLWYVSLAMGSVALFMPFVHLVPYARDRGLSEATGVFLMGLIGVGSLVGRFGLAGIGDRLSRPALLASSYLLMAVMLLVWLASSAAWSLGAFAVLFGAGYGLFVAACPPLAMDFFGARSVAGIIGFAYTAAGLGTLAGPALAGYAFDATGSYVAPILTGFVCMLVAVVCALALKRYPSYIQS